MTRNNGDRPAILISANSFWNIANFRSGLVEALVANGYRVVVAAPGVSDDWAARQKVDAAELEIDRSGLNPFRDAQLLLQYLKLMRTIRPAFYLGFTPKPNIFGSLSAELAGVRAIPNVSGLGTAFIKAGWLGSFLTHLYRIAFRKCPIVMFQNPDDRDLFISRNIVRNDQARLLPGSGVKLDHFKPTVPPDGPPIFLFVGRLLGDKGIREFAAGARELKAEHPDWRFQALGEIDEGNRTGISREELRNWIDEGLIEYLGHAEDVRPHIAASTAVVLPSYREGLPRSLLEAAAMARPMVATDVPGNRQLVKDGINGLLCEARNPRALANAMDRMGSMDAARRADMGRQGRALVEWEYGESRVIRAYLDALAGQANPAEIQA